MSNYPPGVTGSEYQIAGPAYEGEIDNPCPVCDHRPLTVLGYSDGTAFETCDVCNYVAEHELPEPDPDRYHDEELDRAAFGDEGS